MKDCPLCKIKEDQNQKIIFENDLALFAQNEKLQKSCKHSGIIIIKRHCSSVFEFTEEEMNAVFDILKQVKIWMDKTILPEGYNIGWNVGRVAGQILDHAHLHVLPRFPQEPFSGRGIRSWLKSPENSW